jgi:dihydroorotate dehydrogenase electron transfer subunit
MKQRLCCITENRQIWSDVRLLTVDAPELAGAMRPGQFARLRDPMTFDPYLRRTAWFYRVDGGRVAWTLPEGDPLAARSRAGDMLDVLAPLGRAIELDPNARHVLLVGQAAHIAPLLAIAERAVLQQREVVLVGRAAEAFPAHLLPPEIEYRTDPGAMGNELIKWADVIIASGSDELYHALADSVRAVHFQIEPGRVRVLIDVPMPCGTGDCYACAVETRRGIRLACVDGPLFDLSELGNRRTG